jgi:hypothetical protein
VNPKSFIGGNLFSYLITCLVVFVALSHDLSFWYVALWYGLGMAIGTGVYLWYMAHIKKKYSLERSE